MTVNNVLFLFEIFVTCFVINLGTDIKEEDISKKESDKTQINRKDRAYLTPDIIISTEVKEDSKSIDSRSKSATINSPLKQIKNAIVEGENMDEVKKNQPLSCLNNNKIICETKNQHELSQPRIKRRRTLHSGVHNKGIAKESDIMFPFSPVYKRTRSFHKNTSVSNLTVYQKNSVKDSAKS